MDDVLMPPIGLVLGNVDFSNLFLNLSSSRFATLAEAKKAGAATLNYGLFVNSVINFLIIGFAVFLVVKAVNRIRPHETPAPAAKECPRCLMSIPFGASRCGHCTSELG